VIGNSSLSAGGHLHAFIWSKAAGMVGLGVLPGFTDSGTHDINNLGQVVGYCALAGVPNRGFLWSSTAGMQPVGTLPGGLSSDAVGINDLGEIVGTSDSGNVSTYHAVLWDRRELRRIWAFSQVELGVARLRSMFSEQSLGSAIVAGSGSHAFGKGVRCAPSSRIWYRPQEHG